MGRFPRILFKSRWLWLSVGLVLALAFVLINLPARSLPAPAAADNGDMVAMTANAEVVQTRSEMAESASQVNSKQTNQNETVTQQVADTPSSDNCIACHTDEALLKELAEEPEEVHSEEASGEG